MRIGFDAKRAFNNTRGLGNYSRDLIRILTTEHPENGYWLFNAKKKQPHLMEEPDNCSMVEPGTFAGRHFPSLWRSFGIPSDCKRLNLDIYHGLSNEIPYFFGNHSAKTVLTIHDLIFLKFPKLYPRFDRAIYKQKYLSSCSRADSIIAISQQTKNDLLEFTTVEEDRITVIYQGCNPVFQVKPTTGQLDLIRQKYNLPASFVLNVGAIEERKNHKRIIEALHFCKLDVPLVIVGRPVGDWMERLKQIVHAYGMEHQVLFLCDVPTSDLPALYSMSSLFVYPSLYEGFGIPILEAITCGVPVISSRGSCLEEAGGSDSIYIDAKDAEELGHAIGLILMDSSLKMKMSEKGLAHAALFSDASIASRTMQLYQSLL
jgi:glycosyltransferase involved in cell wall biosynthesis